MTAQVFGPPTFHHFGAEGFGPGGFATGFEFVEKSWVLDFLFAGVQFQPTQFFAGYDALVAQVGVGERPLPAAADQVMWRRMVRFRRWTLRRACFSAAESLASRAASRCCLSSLIFDLIAFLSIPTTS